MSERGHTPGERSPRRLLFVGNSHTYQPKELGGLPGAVGRFVSSTCGTELEVDSVVKGGAFLDELWEDFKSKLRDRAGVPRWDTFVLQVGQAPDPQAEQATNAVLKECYAPILRELQPPCTVLLYQTWSGPQPATGEAERLAETSSSHRTALLDAGLCDVRIAPVGHAFLALQEASFSSRRIYQALWKDDSGHASALAGALAAAVVALSLDLLPPDVQGKQQRPLGRILEAMLPSAWRTASPGFAGEADFGQKLWGAHQATKSAPGEVMSLLANTEEDLPLNRYPPGLRTEKRDLGSAFGDCLAAAACEAFRLNGSPLAYPPAEVFGTKQQGAVSAQAPAHQEPPAAPAPTKPRRWKK